MGDGNHSLATAKACYEKLKETMTQESREQLEKLKKEKHLLLKDILLVA